MAALGEVLEIARRESVDAVLIAGDIFDQAVPPPEAERIVFRFLTELVGEGIPAVIIAGNHDHPRRWAAYAPLLSRLGIHVVGEPVSAEEGGVIELASRDGSETAVIAALPWVSERKVRDFEDLMSEGKHIEQYAEGVGAMIRHLCGAFRKDTANILLAHVLIDGVSVGPESGERPLHMGDTYALKLQRLPDTIQYAALGHVHKPQEFRLANAHYCGSLLQCDFGEAGQKKRVNLVEVSPGGKAKVEAVPLTSIRQLRNLGTHKAGLTLEEIRAQADGAGDEYLKVFVKVDRPLPGLAEQIRELLPNAVDIVVERTDEPEREETAGLDEMSPAELFTTYYRDQHTSEPAPELMALFNRLYEEVTGAAD